MSYIRLAADKRRHVADLCTALNLPHHASALGTTLVSKSPFEAREALRKVRGVATYIAANPGAPTNPALELEREAAAAIVLYDRVIDDMLASNARGCEPGLAVGARRGWR